MFFFSTKTQKHTFPARKKVPFLVLMCKVLGWLAHKKHSFFQRSEDFGDSDDLRSLLFPRELLFFKELAGKVRFRPCLLSFAPVVGVEYFQDFFERDRCAFVFLCSKQNARGHTFRESQLNVFTLNIEHSSLILSKSLMFIPLQKTTGICGAVLRSLWLVIKYHTFPLPGAGGIVVPDSFICLSVCLSVCLVTLFGYSVGRYEFVLQVQIRTPYTSNCGMADPNQ